MGMKATTRLFGEIEIEDDKIITLDKGIIGFPDMKHFTLIYDNEKQERSSIMWFQSMDEPQFALPVVSPSDILTDYNPTVNDELISHLGELTDENLFVLVTLKVPSDIKEMTVNLKAPIIINSETKKGGQIIVEDDTDIRFPIYDLLQKRREEAGE